MPIAMPVPMPNAMPVPMLATPRQPPPTREDTVEPCRSCDRSGVPLI